MIFRKGFVEKHTDLEGNEMGVRRGKRVRGSSTECVLFFGTRLCLRNVKHFC